MPSGASSAGWPRASGRLAWLPTILAVLLPVAASVLFVFMGDLDDLGDWIFLVVATLLLLLNAVVAYATTWWRRQDSEADDDEANRLRVAMKDALQPARHRRPITAGNRRGDHALGLVRAAASLFGRDLDARRPREWEGSGADYRTFISAAITNGEYAYGMVTVDAPRASDLGENDRHIVSLVADLLAIAFAEWSPPQVRGGSTSP